MISENRGGKRKGAGRKRSNPALIKKQISLRISPYLKEWLDAQDKSNIELIETALIKQYKIKPKNQHDI